MTSPTDQATLRRAILAMARSRGPDKTFCPSEVARKVAHEVSGMAGEDDDWRRLMGPVRDCARDLAREGCLEITQRGQRLSPDDPWRGAIRLQQRDDRDGG